MARLLVAYSIVVFAVYSMVIRFQNPSLTETELFLKVIGVN